MFLSEESDRMLSLAQAGFTMDEIDVLLRIRTKVNSAETHNASEVRKILFNLFNVEVEETMNRYQDLQQATEVYCDEDNHLRRLSDEQYDQLVTEIQHLVNKEHARTEPAPTGS